jgi:cobalt-zinc-cadmium efflux system outer membrane protein
MRPALGCRFVGTTVISLPRLAACALAGNLAGVALSAQPATSPLDIPAVAADAASGTQPLRDVLDAAWQRAVSAREAEGQRRRADADRAAARRLWAASPSLESSHRDDRFQSNAGKRETEIGLSVPLWLPGQRTAHEGAAEALAAQAQSAEQAARLRLAGELDETAWRVAALKAELRQADAHAAALGQLADDVERRVRAGDLARADSLAAQAEFWAASAVVADARQRLLAALSRWTLLTGLSTLPELSAAPAPNLANADVSRHPEWQLATQTTALARKRVDLIRRSRSDAPQLSVGVRQDTPGRGEGSRGSLVVGLRLPFGTDDRNRALEAAALSDLDIAQTQEQRLRERLDSDIAEAREALRSAQVQVDAQTHRARLLRERAVLVDKSFRAGETPLPDLLRALAAAAQADSAVARQNAALGLARARLQQAFGLLP